MSTGPGLKSRRPDSVKQLLARRAPALMRVTTLTRRANFWNDWLPQHLPADLAARISGVVERDGTLVIFAESAAWSARLRFAVLELEPQLRAAAAELEAIEVRVRPRD
ncbi:MAG: DciA family protein [Steroidobacteraceae bacterium]